MWIFAPEGLLMPAAVPMDKVDPKWTEDGKFDFQIRGRVAEHLQNFIDAYMEPGTFNPEIQLTPEMDYNARFYTTREAFAAAMTKALLAIDYEKFKPQAYDHDRKVHPYYNTLNSIWGSVTALGRPGGKWATPRWGGSKGYSRPTYVGSSFGSREDEGLSFYEDEASGYSVIDSREFGSLDYTPTVEEEIDELLNELSDIPVDQWQEQTTEHEWELVKSIAAARMRTVRKQSRKNRRSPRRPSHRSTR